MIVIHKTDHFIKWLRGLRDAKAVARIQIRIDRFALGNPGDIKSVGSGVSELRIDYGPGYRVYFCKRGTTFVLLLCGGDKTTQVKDIETARKMAKEWNDVH
jgi:putative addiction module killer protein